MPSRLRVLAVQGLLLCLLLALAHPAQAQTTPPDLPTYAGWLREAYAAAQRNDRLGLEDAAARLIATTSVHLPGGGELPADNRWLRDALAAPDPDVPAIGARLGAVLDALALPASAAPPDARARLQELLSNPPFAQADAGAPGWVRAFFDWFWRVLESMFRPIGRAVAFGGNATAWVIAVGGGLLLAAVIGYVLYGLRRNVIGGAQADAADPEARLTARTAGEQAGDLARGGDYRTAVRYMYLSALLWLDERSILRYDRALTNHEYLDRVRANPALRARLGAVVDTFDRVWYGHMPIDAEAFAAYQQQIEALRDDKVAR